MLTTCVIYKHAVIRKDKTFDVFINFFHFVQKVHNNWNLQCSCNFRGLKIKLNGKMVTKY
jgi:hypothetical protein